MNRIRALIQTNRIDQGRSLDDLALFLGIPVQSLVNFESGQGSIEAEELFGLVNALNIDPEEFLNLLSAEDFEGEAGLDLMRVRLRR